MGTAPNKRVMIVAGEASGDLHGSNLVKEALRLDPTLSFFGIGGPHMRAAGVETVVDSSEMAVVGLVEVLAHFGVIYKAYATLKRLITTNPPDLLILIDYPDFNMLVAKVAKRAGVKVLYYISPQVWAWRTGRVKKIARLVDRMAVVFPFEVPFYEKAGVPVSFVGHPLADRVSPSMSRSEALAAFGLDPSRRVVGLFPGSRRGEIARLFPVILESAKLLRDRYPGIQFILPLASSLTDADIAPHLAASGLVVVVARDKVYDVMQVCDAIATVSGTVTLEIALMGVPMVIIYTVSPLTYEVGKRLIRVDHIGICNIVAGERVVPELIQDEATAERIAAEIGRYLDDPVHTEKTRAGLARVREKLGSGGCSERVAGIVLEMLGKKR
ncbi:lipid-A-disaccharide synthase [Geobacter metallireducens RCH3]|uniref:lipid-A-disaccharide synthase n=1 Tax=Geobacter metallireducens TaxID=28232 RepID=UPI00024A51CE|nr:lipid-A-disaccharide synthase [Geobacter metallireducens]EHP86398.1 lipid-A-disaccharide synthase [Geobacter metallireducens RCH3]